MRKWDRGGLQVSCTLHFRGSKTYIAILKKKFKKQSLINQYMDKHQYSIGLTKKWGQGIYSCFEINSMFWTELTALFRLVTRFKHGSSYQGYKNDLKWSEGNQKLLRVSGSSSHGGFELPRVKLQWMYEGNPREINFGSS